MDETNNTNHDASSMPLVSTETEIGELHASLSKHIHTAERFIKGKSEEQRIELGRCYHVKMMRNAVWALCNAAYLGVTLRSLFQGKNDEAKERIAKEVTGYSLSSARRFVKFVDNFPVIQQEAERKGLVIEELGISGCLELVPKEQGRGGRPRKLKLHQPEPNESEHETDVSTDETNSEADEPESDQTEAVTEICDDNSEVTGSQDADAEMEGDDLGGEGEQSGVAAEAEMEEFEVTLTVTGKIVAPASTIGQVVSSLEHGEAEIMAKKPLPVVKDKKTIGKFKIDNIVVKETA